jgi:hypothetical protein
LTISYLVILGIIVTFSFGVDYAFAETEPTDTVITVEMNGPSIFYLDESNQIIRALVEIQNYTPSDGIYFMKVTHLPTQKVMRDFEIYPKQFGDDLWTAQIGYPFLESDINVGGQTLFGEYEIHIRTESGSQTASARFSIFESESTPESQGEPAPEDVSESTPESQDESTPEEQTQIDPPTLELDAGPEDTPAQKIPEWIKNTMGWFAEGLISEDEMIAAIQFLVKEGIIKLD